MEASQSVAKDHDKVDGISHEDGALADVTEEDRGQLWHRRRRLLRFPSLADDFESPDLRHHFRVHNSAAAGANRAERFAVRLETAAGDVHSMD